MVNNKIFIFIILFFSISILTSAEPQEKLKTVVILLSASSEIEDDLFEILAEHLIIQITTSNKNYMIISRDYLNRVLSDLKFKKRDIFNDDTAQKIGKAVEAELVINCFVTMSKNDYNVSIRGIDVESGRPLFSERRQTKNKKDLDKIVEQIVSASKSNIEKEKEEKDRLEKDREEMAKIKAELANEKSTVAKRDAELRALQERIKQYEVKLMEAEKKLLEKVKLEREQLAEEEAEKRFMELLGKSMYNKSEITFINKFYRGLWKFSPDDKDNNLLRYKLNFGTGIGLAASGGTILLAGIISTLVTALYYDEKKYVGEIKDGGYMIETRRIIYIKNSPVLAGILIPTGSLLASLSTIPFFFSFMIMVIYKKATGERLSFFDRVNFNIGMTASHQRRDEDRVFISIGIRL